MKWSGLFKRAAFILWNQDPLVRHLREQRLTKIETAQTKTATPAAAATATAAAATKPSWKPPKQRREPFFPPRIPSPTRNSTTLSALLENYAPCFPGWDTEVQQKLVSLDGWYILSRCQTCNERVIGTFTGHALKAGAVEAIAHYMKQYKHDLDLHTAYKCQGRYYEQQQPTYANYSNSLRAAQSARGWRAHQEQQLAASWDAHLRATAGGYPEEFVSALSQVGEVS